MNDRSERPKYLGQSDLVCFEKTSGNRSAIAATEPISFLMGLIRVQPRIERAELVEQDLFEDILVRDSGKYKHRKHAGVAQRVAGLFESRRPAETPVPPADFLDVDWALHASFRIFSSVRIPILASVSEIMTPTFRRASAR